MSIAALDAPRSPLEARGRREPRAGRGAGAAGEGSAGPGPGGERVAELAEAGEAAVAGGADVGDKADAEDVDVVQDAGGVCIGQRVSDPAADPQYHRQRQQVLALGMALQVVAPVVGVLLEPGQAADYSLGDWLLTLGFLAICALIAFLLWLHPGPLARLASRRSDHQVFESPIDAGQIQWIALSVLGMYWVMSGVLDLAHIGYQCIWLSDLLGTGEEAAQRLQGQVAYNVLEIAIGLALTLGARGLTNLLQKARYAGSSGMSQRTPPASDDAE